MFCEGGTQRNVELNFSPLIRALVIVIYINGYVVYIAKVFMLWGWFDFI